MKPGDKVWVPITYSNFGDPLTKYHKGKIVGASERGFLVKIPWIGVRSRRSSELTPR